MFSFHPHGGPHRGSSAAGRSAVEVHQDRPAAPLDGELLDLYAAILIVVPLAIFLKSFLF